MHETALASGAAFSAVYGKAGMVVVDVGGKNVNGSLRPIFEQACAHPRHGLGLQQPLLRKRDADHLLPFVS